MPQFHAICGSRELLLKACYFVFVLWVCSCRRTRFLCNRVTIFFRRNWFTTFRACNLYPYTRDWRYVYNCFNLFILTKTGGKKKNRGTEKGLPIIIKFTKWSLLAQHLHIDRSIIGMCWQSICKHRKLLSNVIYVLYIVNIYSIFSLIW